MIDTTTPVRLADLTGSYELDTDHSRIGFVARHAMVTKVRGSFTEFEGHVTVGEGGLAQSRVDLTIQAASIETRNAQRDEHLRSNDFLGMEQFPVITFASTQVRQAGPETLEITGDLTIKGVTRQVTVPFEFGGAVTDPDGDFRVGFEGSATINRRDFGITWNAALEAGGVLVSDKIVLELEVAAVRQA